MLNTFPVNYRLLIAYEGTNYCGWQYQPNKPTIVGTLKDVFAEVFKKDVYILGASRTDAGVHALGQVALVTASLNLDPEILRRAWNGRLPSSISIRALEYAPKEFYPFAHVYEKTYYYHFFTKRPLPFIARYGALGPYRFDYGRLQEALSVFIGTHDFRSFCASGEIENTVRTITHISLEHIKRYDIYRITVKGPGFLRYMIRRIVGASLEYASDPDCLISELTDALQACNPQQKFLTAPPQGLMLRKIQYKSSLDKSTSENLLFNT